MGKKKEDKMPLTLKLIIFGFFFINAIVLLFKFVIMPYLYTLEP